MYHYANDWRLWMHPTGKALSNQTLCLLDLLKLKMLGYGEAVGFEEISLKATDNTASICF